MQGLAQVKVILPAWGAHHDCEWWGTSCAGTGVLDPGSWTAQVNDKFLTDWLAGPAMDDGVASMLNVVGVLPQRTSHQDWFFNEFFFGPFRGPKAGRELDMGHHAIGAPFPVSYRFK